MSESFKAPEYRSSRPSPKDYSQGPGLAELRKFHSPEVQLKRTCEIGALACAQLHTSFDGLQEAGQVQQAFGELTHLFAYLTESQSIVRNLKPGYEIVMSVGDRRMVIAFDQDKGHITVATETLLSGTHQAGYVLKAGAITIKPEGIHVKHYVLKSSNDGSSVRQQSINATLLPAPPDLPHDDPRHYAAQIDQVASEDYAGGGRATIQIWNARGQKGIPRGVLSRDPALRQMSYDRGPKPLEPVLHYAPEPQFAQRVPAPQAQTARRMP